MHVVVTGASSGIGEALVREYVKHGASVTMLARRKEAMDAIASSVGGNTLVICKDLSVVETAGDWIETAEERFGPIDVFINNAGVQIVAQLKDTEPEHGRQLLRLDLETPMVLMNLLVPKMLERGSGTLVNISSLAGIAPTPGMFYYNAAKAGLGAASEALRGELRKTGVHVLTVYPGPVATPMAAAAIEAIDSPTASMIPEGTTEVLARKIRKGVVRRKARIIYPFSYVVARHLPGWTRWLMDRFSPLPPSKPTPTQLLSEQGSELNHPKD